MEEVFDIALVEKRAGSKRTRGAKRTGVVRRKTNGRRQNVAARRKEDKVTGSIAAIPSPQPKQ